MKEKLTCIMMIDDDEPTNFISAMILEEADCSRQYQIIDSALKALDYLKNAGSSTDDKTGNVFPELIFLDINMPRMNGWEFLEEYKKMECPDEPKPVIIMLTTSLHPGDKVKAEANPQIAGFESKPLTTEMIQRVIDMHFPGYKKESHTVAHKIQQ